MGYLCNNCMKISLSRLPGFRFWLAFLLIINFLSAGYVSSAQSSCNGVTPNTVTNCATSEVAVGTQTELSYSYTWYLNGAVKKGPLAGSGGAVSFNFAVNGPGDAGLYTIEKTIDGVTTCA